jgi:hypothetical protein
MALSDNPFIGLPIAQQQQLQQAYVQVMLDIAATGKSYSFPGLQLTRADLAEIRDTLSLLRLSIEYDTGQARQIAYGRADTQNQFDPLQYLP